MLREVNPNMLKLARQFRGYSQEDLSEELSISQGKLSKLEQGLLRVHEEDIRKLSEHLKMPIEFFHQNDSIFPPVTPVQRSKSGLRKKNKERLEAVANIYRLHHKKLLEAVEEPDIRIPRLNDNQLEMQPSEAATATRAALKLPYGPVKNMVETLENAGVFVIPMDFGTNQLDGFTMIGDGIHPLIFINKKFPIDRIRFTLAHELGHLVIHTIPNAEMEKEADEFASEFLMPAEEIENHLTDLNLRKLADLKRYWKVSMQALLMRAKSLETITENQARYLWMQMSHYGYRRKEPVDLPPERPSLSRELVNIHLTKLGYTRAQLCKLLVVREEDFENLYGDAETRLRLVKK